MTLTSLLAEPNYTATPRPASLADLSFTEMLDQRQMRLRSRRMMLVLSQLIEDHAASVPGTFLIATFQRYSLYQKQLRRYKRLARDCAQVFVMGLPDDEAPAIPKVEYLPLEATWPLIHEWVVIASGPACCVALFACDNELAQPERRSRNFRALWTTNTHLVDSAVATFYSAIGQRPPHIMHDSLATYHTTVALQQELPVRLRENLRAH